MDKRPKQSIAVDVLVAGGGAAGVAAACTAARQGLKVLLVERYGFCGGGAVAGLSGTVCGLYLASEKSRQPEQVVHGFVDDFIEQLERRNGIGPTLRYGKTYTRVHEPLAWRESADALLEQAGVNVLYHALVTEVLLDGDRVSGAIVWTKSGLLDVRANVTIDASGDADLVSMAGWRTWCGVNGVVQNPTMIFRLQGVDLDRFRAVYGGDTIMPAEVTEKILQAQQAGCDLPRAKIWLFPTTRPGELLCNCTRVRGADGRELNAVNADDFSEAETQGRRQVRQYARFFREQLAGCESSWVNDTGVQVGIRQTRQLAGRGVLRNQDILQGHKSAEGIARSPWPIELHAGQKPRVEWLLDDFYEVPFDCFVPEKGEGLLAAGRCLSAEHEAVASARVTAQCFSYGQAIGLAAAVASRENLSVQQLSGRELRVLLNQQGARL